MLQCNIDQRGRRVRLGWGVVMLLLAAASVVANLAGWWPGVWAYLAAGVLAALGGFALFEAWKGWCGVRALGFRTPV